MCENGGNKTAQKLHPLSLLRMAYGYDDNQQAIPGLQVLSAQTHASEEKT